MKVFGRRSAARFGQALSNWARLDVPNKPWRNGELLVQRQALEHAGANPVFFDVGANIGEWTASLLTAFRESKAPRISIHAFEPCAGTRQTLVQAMRREDPDGVVTIVPLAMSDAPGTRSFYVIGAGAGRNSLYSTDLEKTVEQVEAMTLDEYAAQVKVDRIAFVKVDTEGHDMSVIEGAKGLLKDRRIGVLQFEYNHMWVRARHYLKDVFDFAAPLGYTVGKITPAGIERYPKWHQELETFREANYLLASEETLGWFPSVRWWNA